ncbi:autotransporter outer membrane beta-barrel domain-containing protein [Fusobacterium ulcerans]|uniref:autotransporter family protein n=1 Tax=Fusobacterium ulcerans TaxID=861 RepID=UPI001032803B|nr:autotransporter outer membrane beta-barrel domain-containing protein [Fusobacterium ulcerans]
MIEKIMKSIKSGNKKTGRNITIGTVVGMLLSCTAVMGADKYLWIKENGETVKFNTVATTDAEGTGGNWNEEHPYDDENIWNADTKTYINNMTLLSTGINITTDGYARNASCALKLSGDLGGVINNSLIMGADISNVVRESSGIYIYNSSNVETITNNGLIAASAGGSAGIYNFSAVETLTNTGSIMGTGQTGGYGIRTLNIPISPASLANLTNTGLIAGVTSGSDGIGVAYINANMEVLTNSGLIKGTGSEKGWGILIGGLGGTSGSIVNNGLITGTGGSDGFGIANRARGTLETMTNTGVIYGKKFAVDNDNATITSLNNYGILAAQTSAVISLYGTQTLNNYGLMFKGYSGNYTAKDDTDYGKFGTTTEINRYTVINTKAEGTNKDKITGTESLELENGGLTYNDSIGNPQTENVSLDKKYILNGITDTLLVSIGDNKFNNSVINAYETAVKFDTAGGILTLTGTIVNGGADGISDTVTGSDNEDTLTLQSGNIVNGNISMENGNDIFVIGSGATINGNTNMGDNDDILTVEAESIINGTLNGGMGRDTLNFDSPITRDAANGGINIYHNISGFENMNTNTNVTLFEKTVKDDGSVGDLTVTDAENITIGADGILTLRIDISKLGTLGDASKIVGHALYGNTGIIKSETGGKLLLAVNGAGNESIISFGGTKLDNSLITGSRGNFDTTSKLHTIESIDGANNEVKVVARWIIPEIFKYKQLNKIYHGILSVDGLGNFIVDDDERLSTFIGYLNDIYAGNPYSYSSELSRKSAGMFRDIVTENIFKPEANKWMIYGGLTHVDGGTKDTYYGKGYYTYDIGSSDMDADTKITGAYMLGEYGVSDTLTSGVVIGGNKLKSDLSNGSKVDGSALYLGAYAKKYIGNLKVTAGTGFQYGDYDADRMIINKVAFDETKSVMKYSDNYNDMTYDIYLNGRYSLNIGENLFLEPYGTLSYTYIDQDGADEGNQTLAIETDSKSFDYTVGKVGLDLKKVIPHEKGKSTLSAGVSYTRILDGADEEFITGRFKGGRDFDILVAHKNEHSIGLNAKYAIELENGVLFDVKGTYAVERDSHNGAGKNKAKGEWIVGAGLGYKF